MPTEHVWVRRIVKLTVTAPDGSERVFSASENEFLLCPVCNGGAISVDTYNVQTGDFMIAVVIAHGHWKEVKAETGLIKVEVNQQGQAITKAH